MIGEKEKDFQHWEVVYIVSKQHFTEAVKVDIKIRAIASEIKNYK